MFLALSPIFWPWVVTIYVFPLHLRCGVLLTITGKRLISVLLFSSPSFSVRLSSICYRSGILVPCCVVVSCGVICYFSQYWSFFFFRFWLRLETTSCWVGSEFSCHWCCFPRRWFAVNGLCSSWFSSSGFWWSDFYALFHSSRMALRFVDFILSLFVSLFSHLVAPFIVDHVSCGFLFRHICYSRFGSVFLCACFVCLEGCLWSQA